MRLMFVVEYDGSRFQGYEVQPGCITVQSEFEAALEKCLGFRIKTFCAGRTDRGVHAIGQVIACTLDTKMPLKAIRANVQCRLPMGIRIRSLDQVHDDFHPRYHALRRAYRYVMTETLAPSVFLEPYVTFLRRPLDWDRVRQAASLLVGTHNFVSFAKRPIEAVRLERSIESIEISSAGEFAQADFEARGFLRGMIRNIMGWLIAVGEGQAEPEVMVELLARRVKDRGIEPAAPQGLYLVRVWYPPERLELPRGETH
ncbi:MAG: tRNA pseudouridine(38-40) synthase TruA [Candidatus Wallbacteria bacterium]|nr:tRNA pseudouridine(38-40) synthase TruA [Candidatus Wallbacteria bacterium]